MIKASVCIPVFNGGKYIAEAIESVLGQTFKGFELIVLDNCSTDNTVAIVKSFEDSRIKLYQHSENIGFCNNWNYGLKAMNGEYIKFLPADDLLNKNCLETQIRILDQNPDVGLVSCSRLLIDENGKKLLVNRGLPEGKFKPSEALKDCALKGGNTIGEPVACLFRRSVIDRGESFSCNSLFCIDLDFWAKILSDSMLYKVNEPLVSFRVSSESTSVALLNSQAKEITKFVRDLELKKIIYLSPLEKVLSQTMILAKSILRGLFYKVIIS